MTEEQDFKEEKKERKRKRRKEGVSQGMFLTSLQFF